METPTVTLTTDWGQQGFFAGMVKGALMRSVEGVRVVDVSHSLAPYNVMTASFVVRHACTGFPQGTVHIVDVGSREPFVALQAHGQYYICSDNGLPALALGDNVSMARRLPTREGGVYNFAAYNLFVPVATRLLRGEPLDTIGEPYTLRPSLWPGYVQQGDYYRIYVHYVDDYGNVYLGMSYDEFEQLRQGRAFVMQVRDIEVTEFSTTYYRGTTADMRLQLTVSATGQLELALRERSLAQLVGLQLKGSVLLRFK